jgi:hypothetical protein
MSKNKGDLAADDKVGSHRKEADAGVEAPERDGAGTSEGRRLYGRERPAKARAPRRQAVTVYIYGVTKGVPDVTNPVPTKSSFTLVVDSR